MKTALLLVSLVFCSSVIAGTAHADGVTGDKLQLICKGRGNVRLTRTFVRYFIDSVRVEIEDGSGRILMPQDLWPILRGGNEGWYPLEKLVRTETEIVAKVDAGLFDHARVSIDRLSGTILIQSLESTYNGKCELHTPESLKPKF